MALGVFLFTPYTHPKDFCGAGGRLGRFELYGQYNKLIRSFHKTFPSPTEDEGANTKEKPPDCCTVSKFNFTSPAALAEQETQGLLLAVLQVPRASQ